ncbi:MAG: hypothetical protein ACRYG8_27920 [Janthinobacterium lividum]
MKTYPGAYLENLLIRQTALSVILQGLMDTMIAKGLLNSDDIVVIRRYAMDLSRDMLDVVDAKTRAAGIKIGEEVEVFLRVLVGLPLDPNEDEGLA